MEDLSLPPSPTPALYNQGDILDNKMGVFWGFPGEVQGVVTEWHIKAAFIRKTLL